MRKYFRKNITADVRAANDHVVRLLLRDAVDVLADLGEQITLVVGNAR